MEYLKMSFKLVGFKTKKEFLLINAYAYIQKKLGKRQFFYYKYNYLKKVENLIFLKKKQKKKTNFFFFFYYLTSICISFLNLVDENNNDVIRVKQLLSKSKQKFKLNSLKKFKKFYSSGFYLKKKKKVYLNKKLKSNKKIY